MILFMVYGEAIGGLGVRDDQVRRQIEYAARVNGETPAEVVAEVEDDDVWQGDDGEGKTRGWPHLIARYTSLVAVGAMLGFTIIGTMKFVNDPVVAKGTSLGAATASVAPAPGTAQTSVLQGLNFQFSYSSMFDQVAQQKSGANFIEQYMLSSKVTTAHQVAVGLENFKGSSLNDLSDWELRKNQPNVYTERLDKSGSDPIGIMTKSDKTEQSMFWIHGDKVLEISVTTSDPKDNVESIMTVIKGSLKWRR